MSKKRKIWYEDDDFWKKWEPVLFRKEIWERTAQEVTDIIALLGIKKGATILDLCCGPGRHALEFARRGYNVTGVDRTEGYLIKARRKARSERLKIKFVQQDMRDFRCGNKFDAVINLYTSFGYFQEIADDKLVIKNIFSALKPNGKFMIEMMSKEILARIFRPFSWWKLDQDTLIFEEHRICRGWGWIENSWYLIRNGKIEKFNLSHRLYSAVELTGLLIDSGFRCFEVYGGLDGRPYDHQANRLVIIAHK